MTKHIYPLAIILLLTVSCILNPEKEDTKGSDKTTIAQSLLPETDALTYLLLTNPTEISVPIPRITINGQTSRKLTVKNISESTSFNRPKRLDKNIKFRRSDKIENSRNITIIDYDSYNIGDLKDFNIYIDNISTSPVKFTLKSKIPILADNSTELFLWSNSSVEPPSGAIEHLGSKFIEIYSEMIKIFGSPWGVHNSNNLLASTNRDIHILLTDIYNDKNLDLDGIVYGYFDGNDTIVSNSSNQCLNMVIDSYNFFKGTVPVDETYIWTKDNVYVAITLSTIIHEFQHMIHFYNKQVKQNLTDTFFNEMFSMISEEIMAEKHLKFMYEGFEKILTPNIDRLPTFNIFWDQNSSFYWNSTGYDPLNNYSMSYAMGAYLIRNYGLPLFKKYMSINSAGKNGILEALNSIDKNNEHTVKTLLHNFGTAVLRSSKKNTESVPYKFNNSTTLISGETEYYLYPLNFFDSTIYKYYALGSETNRLSNYEYEKTIYNAPFYTLTVEELNHNSNELMFKSESNIYVNLGELSNTDEVIIDFFNSELDIVYKLVF